MHDEDYEAINKFCEQVKLRSEIETSQRHRPKFSGLLTSPIRCDPPPTALRLLLYEDMEAAWAKWQLDRDVAIAIETMARVPLLFRHYGIDPPIGEDAGPSSQWAQLAIRIARDYLPGFGIIYRPKKVSRDTKWTAEKQLALYLSVRDEAATRATGRSAKSACERLAGKWPWNEANATKNSLYARYNESKKSPLVWLFKRFDPLVMDAERYKIIEAMMRELANPLPMKKKKFTDKRLHAPP